VEFTWAPKFADPRGHFIKQASYLTRLEGDRLFVVRKAEIMVWSRQQQAERTSK